MSTHWRRATRAAFGSPHAPATVMSFSSGPVKQLLWRPVTRVRVVTLSAALSIALGAHLSACMPPECGDARCDWGQNCQELRNGDQVCLPGGGWEPGEALLCALQEEVDCKGCGDYQFGDVHPADECLATSRCGCLRTIHERTISLLPQLRDVVALDDNDFLAIGNAGIFRARAGATRLVYEFAHDGWSQGPLFLWAFQRADKVEIVAAGAVGLFRGSDDGTREIEGNTTDIEAPISLAGFGESDPTRPFTVATLHDSMLRIWRSAAVGFERRHELAMDAVELSSMVMLDSNTGYIFGEQGQCYKWNTTLPVAAVEPCLNNGPVALDSYRLSHAAIDRSEGLIFILAAAHEFAQERGSPEVVLQYDPTDGTTRELELGFPGPYIDVDAASGIVCVVSTAGNHNCWHTGEVASSARLSEIKSFNGISIAESSMGPGWAVCAIEDNAFVALDTDVGETASTTPALAGVHRFTLRDSGEIVAALGGGSDGSLRAFVEIERDQPRFINASDQEAMNAISGNWAVGNNGTVWGRHSDIWELEDLELENPADLLDIYEDASGDQVWIVGDDKTIVRGRRSEGGIDWQQLAAPGCLNDNRLVGVGLHEGAVVALSPTGQLVTLERADGTAISEPCLQPPVGLRKSSSQLADVHVDQPSNWSSLGGQEPTLAIDRAWFEGNDIWAVGDAFTHYDGRGWRRIHSIPNRRFTAVHGVARNPDADACTEGARIEIWAIASEPGGTDHSLWHYDGWSLSEIQMANIECTEQMTDLRAHEDQVIVACGLQVLRLERRYDGECSATSPL